MDLYKSLTFARVHRGFHKLKKKTETNVLKLQSPNGPLNDRLTSISVFFLIFISEQISCSNFQILHLIRQHYGTCLWYTIEDIWFHFCYSFLISKENPRKT